MTNKAHFYLASCATWCTTGTSRNFIAVIGRMHGDDEDQCRLYEDMTVTQARQQLINELRRDDNIPEADIVAECAYTNVYITHVLSSRDETIEE